MYALYMINYLGKKLMIWGSKLSHFVTFCVTSETLTTRTRNIRNVNKDSSARRKANRNYTFLFLTQTSLLVGRPKETAHFFSRLRSFPRFYTSFHPHRCQPGTWTGSPSRRSGWQIPRWSSPQQLAPRAAAPTRSRRSGWKDRWCPP